MIRIKDIHIEEFRGIRNLYLSIGSKNFGICGRNGTGKSGVVDAIEFCLTGDITRLSGQGSSGLSLKKHAPHVDCRNKPENAKVTITASIPPFGKEVTISRSVKNSSAVEINPLDSLTEDTVKMLQIHPEFALSRREIVKYIITPPGQRSKDVQTLLRLDFLEHLRRSFTTFANRCNNNTENAKRVMDRARQDLETALDLTEPDHTQVLEKVNEKRQILGLPALNELTPSTPFCESKNLLDAKSERSTLAKEIALADLRKLINEAAEITPKNLMEHRQEVQGALESLQADERALILVRQHGFIKTGLDLIVEDACPFCDTLWDAEDLRKHLEIKLLSAQEVEATLDKLLTSVNGILDLLETRVAAVHKIAKYFGQLNPPIQQTELDNYAEDLNMMREILNKFLEDHTQIEETLKVVNQSWWALPTVVQTRIDKCIKAIEKLPDSSEMSTVRNFLIVLEDRYRRYLNEKKNVSEKEGESKTAQKILGYYNSTSISVLETIYMQVANDFSKYYRIINHEDENNFVGELISEPAKLTLNVDFYGRGDFPPGAYHSEGHQDGMGLCLYLALMKHTLGDKFTFAVLDDVLMSVDTGHRREVCRLLKSEFSNTQFILTTHDRVWLQYMKTENLIQDNKIFDGWNVDSGPNVWDDQDIWSEIQIELDKNNTPKAAGLLRYYLEYIAPILADNLRARIEFRGDANYSFGDLLPSVFKEWSKRLVDGEKAAQYWGDTSKKDALATKRSKAKTLVANTKMEEWHINPSVHFNEWANFENSEFQIVVDAFKALLEHMRCANPQCKEFPYVTPYKGSPESLRCSCGTININLKSK